MTKGGPSRGGKGRKAVAVEGSPAPNHPRQVEMGRHRMIRWNVSWGCFRDWSLGYARAVAWGERISWRRSLSNGAWKKKRGGSPLGSPSLIPSLFCGYNSQKEL